MLLGFMGIFRSSAGFFLQDTSWCIQKTVIPYSYQTEEGKYYGNTVIQGNEMPAYVFLSYGVLVVTYCSSVDDYYENAERFDVGEWKLKSDTLEITLGKPNPKVERFFIKKSPENENMMRLCHIGNMDTYDVLVKITAKPAY